MANENNKKIPCGGFYLGDGLTMDGNTLKSLGGEQVQTDYAQNDPTAKDYIKNRPGGYEEGFEITWDGDTTGRVSATAEDMPFAWYKVSDEILALDQIVGSKFTSVAKGGSQSIIIDSSQIFYEDENIIILSESLLIAAKASGTYLINGINLFIPEAGVYFAYINSASYVSALSNLVVHPFDDKYIPDTIARKAELDSRITEKEVILTSSTTDSTKKFKITVDDNGVISATEITK